jgi:hypothetical protein
MSDEKRRRLEREARQKEIDDNLYLVDIQDKLLQKIEKKIKNVKQINDLRDELLTNLTSQNKNQEQQNKLIDDYKDKLALVMDRRTKDYKTLTKQADLTKDTIKQEQKRIKITDELKSKSDGILDSIESQVQRIPLIGGLLSKSIDVDDLKDKLGKSLNTVTQDFQKLQKTNGVGNALSQSFKGVIPSISSVGKTLMKSLLPILPIVAAIATLKTAFTLDKQVTELSRNMGISRAAALDMQMSFKSISDSAGNLTTGEIAEAQSQLAEATGMAAMFTDEMLQSQAELTKFYGLSGDEAANLNTFMQSIGSDAETLKGEVVGVVEQFNQGTGASINMKDVLKDIAGLSATMKTNFKGNVTEMAKAVTLARAMGTSLEKSSQAAEKTLDIESSLKAELMAQMATGVKIDNSEIRRAQLMGDQAKVLELQRKQMEEIGDISDMVPRQREAIAQAMGMELSELDEMNERMEMQKKLGVDISDATISDIENAKGLSEEQRQQLIAEKERLSMQEKMNMMTEKLQELFVNIAPVLMGIVDVFSSIVGFIGHMITGISESKILLATLAISLAPLAVSLITSAISAIFTGFGMLGPFGIPLAIAAVGGMMSMIGSAKEVGDVMSPADGKTRVSTKEGGLFELSPNDDLVAAPGLLGGGGMDLTPLINAINGLRSDIQSQPIQMVVDGRVVSSISKVQAKQQSVNTTGYGK